LLIFTIKILIRQCKLNILAPTIQIHLFLHHSKEILLLLMSLLQ
jgi:hypothetical protein